MPTDPGETGPRRRGRRPGPRPEAPPRLPPTVSRPLPLRGGGAGDPAATGSSLPPQTPPWASTPAQAAHPQGRPDGASPRPGSRRAARLAETGTVPAPQPGPEPMTGSTPMTGSIPVTGGVPVTGRVPRRTMGLPESFDDGPGPDGARRRGAPTRGVSLRNAAEALPDLMPPGDPGSGDPGPDGWGGPSPDRHERQRSPYAVSGGDRFGDEVEHPADPEPVRGGRRSRRGRPLEADDAAGVGNGALTRGEPGEAGEARAGRQPTGAGRAGRNLPAAIMVGVVLLGLVLASLLIRKEGFVAVVAAGAVVGVWELSRAFAVRDIVVPLVPLAVGSVGMVVSAFVAGEDGLLVSFGLTAFGLLLWRIIDGAESAAGDVAASIFSTAYVPFLGSFTMLMLAAGDGVQRIVTFVLVTVSSDIGGYAAGVLFGRHPMAPSVSPKKSWEGFLGSVLACVLVGVVTVVVLLHGPWWAGAALGAASALTATVGDLAESLLKRDLGIKDMGHLLPGHGGLLDRIDSVLVTAPAAYVLLSLLV